jgi:hypothetical protein
MRKVYIGDCGEPGDANFKKGKSAEHLIIEVSEIDYCQRIVNNTIVVLDD